MSSVTKENEVLTAIPENAARPQPVALEVAVTVNGARAVAGSDKREPFSESTKSVLVFAHGAVVRLSSSVAPGQLLFLTNEKTKKEVVCQVVNSKNYSSVSGYVELEFTEPVSGFWGMRFPAAPQGHSSVPAPASSPTARNLAIGSVAEPKAPATAAAIQPETKSTISSSPRVSQTVPSTPAISSNQPSAPQSAALTSPPASLNATPTYPSSAASTDALEIPKPIKTPTVAPPITPKTSAVPSKSMLDSEEIKIPSWLEPLARNAAAASAALPEIKAQEPAEDFGDIPVLDDLAVTEITDTPEGANRGVPSSSFGTHFLAEEHDGHSEEATAGKSSKKFLIGAIAAGGLLLVGAGGWYMRQSSDNVGTNNSANTAAVSTASNAANNSVNNNDRTQSQPPARTSTPERPAAKFTSVSAPATTAPDASSASKPTKFVDANRASLSANKNIATVDSASASDPAADVAAPAPQKKQNLGAVKLSAPIVNKASEPAPTEEALNLEPSQPTAGLAPGLVGSSSRQPVAPSSGPDIKSATLISSVAPAYPLLAKNQRITGGVTIDALIDVTGHVASMTVVSGPALLRDAAQEALRHWKYAPAELHGKPVPMHMTVTIQFKLQ